MTRGALVLLLGFVALGALPAGALLSLDPSGGRLGFTTAMLEGSPFPDFLVPGLFLLGVHGLGSAAAGVLVLRRARHAPALAAGLGAALVAWIGVQVAIIGWTSALQPLMLAVGLGELALGLALARGR